MFHYCMVHGSVREPFEWRQTRGCARLMALFKDWWRYWLPVLAYASLIFYLSSLPHPEQYFPSFLINVSDKVIHGVEYGVLGILWFRAFRHAAGGTLAAHAVLFAIIASAAYGVTDEFHQAFVPFRNADVWDAAADTVGAAVGTWSWSLAVKDGP